MDSTVYRLCFISVNKKSDGGCADGVRYLLLLF